MSDLDKEELEATRNIGKTADETENEIEKIIQFMLEDNYNISFISSIRSLMALYKTYLSLYNKEKEKNKELLENATVTYFNDEELKESVGNYLGVLLKKNIEKDYISKNKIREIIYPTPTNPISYEIQTSDMYRKILQLLEEK